MSGDRRGPLAVGALTVVMGAVLFLAAGDVIPQPDEKFGAPRWIVAGFGLAFFFGGWYVLALGLPTPRMRRVLGAATALMLVTGGAVLLTWLALTGGGAGRSSVSVGAVSVGLPGAAARGIVRMMIWVFAVASDAIALVAWFVAIRSLVRRESGGRS